MLLLTAAVTLFMLRMKHDVWLALIVGSSGLQLLGLGWVGEYVWTFQQSLCDRPPFIVERVIGPSGHEVRQDAAS